MQVLVEVPVAELPQPLRPHPQVPIRRDLTAEHAVPSPAPSQSSLPSPPPSSSPSVPVHEWKKHWLSVPEFAALMHRHEQTVYWWLRKGTLVDFGIPTYQFRGGRAHSGRTFILNIY
jgi:hypothetical protein